MFGLTILFGAGVGFALGLTGGGGGVFAVPMLVYGLSVGPREALGISLASVGGTALSGVIPRLIRGDVELRTGLLFAVAGMIGAPLGSYLATLVPESLLLVIFLISMSGVSSFLISGRELPLDTTLQFLIGGLLGMWLGGMVALRLNGPALQKVFASAVVFVEIFDIVKSVVL